MDEDERNKRCDKFREDYYARMQWPSILTSERIVIVDNLCQLHNLVRPQMIPRENSEEPVKVQKDEIQNRIGRFRNPEEDRKCITADMDIIRFYIRQLNEEPPKFR
jgi:hypothetical protein